MADTKLKIRNIHSYYGSSHVIQGVDLDVSQNQIVGLLGRNGMGKTTLIRSIMNLTPPEIKKGTIQFFEKDVTGLPPHKIAQHGIGYVPQGRRIFSSLTVEKNLTLAFQRTIDPQQTTYDLNEIFAIFPRLRERKNHLGSHLSGGEQQMLAIGRALITNPRLLLMDEPSEGLAPQLVNQLKDRIRRLKQEDIPILLVEQNLNLALEVADYIYVLERGKITFEDTAVTFRDRKDLQRKLLGV